MTPDGEVCRLPGPPSGPRDPDLYGDDDLVARLLADAQTWFIVGLSTNRARAAYGVAEFLHRKGRTIVPIHPKAEDVLGFRGSPRWSKQPPCWERPTSWIVSCAANWWVL